MRLLSTLAIVALAVTPIVATAQTAPAKPAYSSETTMGELMGNPATKAVLEKNIPALVGQDTSQGAAMSLKAIQQYIPDLTDAKLAQIDAELAKIPAAPK